MDPNNVNKASDSVRRVCTIKMCLDENYSRVRLGKSVSDMFPTKMV